MKRIVILTADEVAASKRGARRREAFRDSLANGWGHRVHTDRRRKVAREDRQRERAAWKRGDY